MFRGDKDADKWTEQQRNDDEFQVDKPLSLAMTPGTSERTIHPIRISIRAISY